MKEATYCDFHLKTKATPLTPVKAGRLAKGSCSRLSKNNGDLGYDRSSEETVKLGIDLEGKAYWMDL